VLFQGSLDRFPILRRRFHDDFFNLLLEQPVGQRSQLGGITAKPPTLKLVLASISTSETTASILL
jgi:hypothetical protein